MIKPRSNSSFNNKLRYSSVCRNRDCQYKDAFITSASRKNIAAAEKPPKKKPGGFRVAGVVAPSG